jgi:hypothetical protein
MKRGISITCLICTGQFLLSLTVSSASAVGEGTLTKAEAKEYFRMYAKLHPEKGDLYQQLVKTFPNTESFTTSQVTYVTDPNVKKPIKYPTPPPKPPTDPDIYMSQADMMSAAQAKKELDVRDALELAQHKSWYALLAKYGKQDWYLPDQVREFEKKQEPPKPPQDQLGRVPHGALTARQAYEQLADFEKHEMASNPSSRILKNEYGDRDYYPPLAIKDVMDNGAKGGTQPGARQPPDPAVDPPDVVAPNSTFLAGFKSPKIRQSWRDVLYAEDPSQTGNETKTIKDLVGATFSYAHDNTADLTTWTAIGAVIWPWEQDFSSYHWIPTKLVLAPSVSMNRVGTNDPAKTAADSVLFRMGSYLSWSFGTDPGSGLEVRAAGVYATDTDGNARLPGYEVDLEPRWDIPFVRLGYTHAWIQKAPTKDPSGAEPIDDVVLATKLRAWLHMEGGDVQDNGASWDPVMGSFFRIGPTTQLQITMPRVIFGKALSLTALYSYLAAISGSDAHQSFFTVSATYDLYKSDFPTENRKISLTAQYQKGGLNFTKEDTDAFTLGLGVLY